MSDRKLISIICAVFNEEEAIPLFYERLQGALSPLREQYDFELIFTNNRSSDRTLDVILDLRRKDPAVQVLTLSRNFGYQASVMAGLRHASGAAIVVIDVDCEDPPEMIRIFVKEWENGFDIVYGERVKRSEFYGLQLVRKAFYRLNRLLADSEIILDMAEFSLISARVRDLILENDSTFPFLRTEVAYVGFDRKGIPYKRQPRLYGKTHYNFISMVQFAIGGILSSSTFPLRLAAYLCFPFVLTNLFLLYLELWAGVEKAFHILVVMDFLYVLLFIACICIYLARSYKNGVARPVFIVDWRKSALNSKSSLHVQPSSPGEVWTTDKCRIVSECCPQNDMREPSEKPPAV